MARPEQLVQEASNEDQVFRPIENLTEAMDSLLVAEEIFYTTGVSIGQERGSEMGSLQGASIGYAKGNETGSEIGFYKGSVEAWRLLEQFHDYPQSVRSKYKMSASLHGQSTLSATGPAATPAVSF
ncbi:hypothetical protein PROFUN_05365 [Planoprotostelium fungivorum]|uniref:Essential protein Yae1 N-terminal domain-containing protein n=1 Tax=Planoprotostelium fungivorum TaxID=1890364 RepID=A0A2P6NR64_9EUKA|nr:hypothetical protein PROFUN_05365 [Planoprotostelium fungivorum]